MWRHNISEIIDKDLTSAQNRVWQENKNENVENQGYSHTNMKSYYKHC